MTCDLHVEPPFNFFCASFGTQGCVHFSRFSVKSVGHWGSRWKSNPLDHLGMEFKRNHAEKRNFNMKLKTISIFFREGHCNSFISCVARLTWEMKLLLINWGSSVSLGQGLSRFHIRLLVSQQWRWLPRKAYHSCPKLTTIHLFETRRIIPQCHFTWGRFILD